LGRNEGRGAGLVAGTGEPEAAQERKSRGGAGEEKPGRCRRGKAGAAQDRESRGECCWGQIAGAAQARESRGGAARRGVVEGKK